MASVLSRGLVAGAVGTALIDAATYVDMLLTDREASDAPGRTVVALAERAGVALPDDDSRLAAYGQLGGLAAGLGVGVAASGLRALGVRLPMPVRAAATGLAAMAATDGSIGLSGIDDPSTWSAADWARDALPHLVYGAGVQWTLDRMDDGDETPEPGRVTFGLLLRSAAIGAATGARVSLGALTPLLASGRRRAAAAATALVATELVVDKLPQTTSRLDAGGQLSRYGVGGLSGAALAVHDNRSPVLPALAGVAGAVAGTIAGAAWREAAAERGWTWQAGLVEDAAALALVVVAAR